MEMNTGKEWLFKITPVTEDDFLFINNIECEYRAYGFYSEVGLRGYVRFKNPISRTQLKIIRPTIEWKCCIYVNALQLILALPGKVEFKTPTQVKQSKLEFIWICGKGTGLTNRLHHMYSYFGPRAIYFKDASVKYWNQYAGERIILLRAEESWKDIIHDMRESVVELYRDHKVVLQAEVVFIISSSHPRAVLGAEDEDELYNLISKNIITQ